MGVETVALMSTLAGGLAVGGGVLGLAGALQQGQAQKEAADYNATVDNQRAAAERDTSRTEAQDYARHGSAKVGQALALQGASGVTPAGSPLMVDAATIREVALGTAHTLYSGERRARALQNEAGLATAEGENAITASYINAGSSLLSGASKATAAYGGYGRGLPA